MNRSIEEKNKALGKYLTEMKKVAIAFSGGVDSSFLLKRAKEELGENVIAIVVASELFKKEEFKKAVALAKELGVKVYETEIRELSDTRIVENTPDSWYFSKKMLYKKINEIAEELNYPYVLDGMIMDDINDFRPGLQARTEEGVRSLLQEAGIYKNEIRDLSKEIGLSVWNKSASCSVASRIPYGEPISEKKIKQIMRAESFLNELGFDPVRVRHHDNIARVEVEPKLMTKFIENNTIISNKLKSLGFAYVSLDIEGYRTGSMNEIIDKKIS